MTKVTKSERKYGNKKDISTNVTKKPRGRSREIQDKPEEEMFKILVDGSGFTKAMTHDDCLKTIERFESKARKLRRPLPSLILVKQ